MASARPTGLIANSGLELLTWQTPNGHKASILLEELKAVYGKDYVYQAVDIGTNVQKEPWFTKLGPNGRIPVLIDHDNGGYSLMEGAGKCSIEPSSSQPPISKTHCYVPQLSSRTSFASTTQITNSASLIPPMLLVLSSGLHGNMEVLGQCKAKQTTFSGLFSILGTL